MSKRLESKVALVTGAGTGIGEAVAHKFAREGARLTLNGLPDDPVEEVAQTLRKHGAEVEVYLGDVSQEPHARACVEAAVGRFGRLDVLVNNAGVLQVVAPTEQYPVEAFDRMLACNVRSTFLVTRFALPHLQSTRGNVVSNGSEGGFKGTPNQTPYGGTKAWVHAFMMGVAVEQARHGVRANCVCPGPIDTAWTHSETGPISPAMERALLEATPLGRRGTPEEVANVFAFLASDEASFVTGALYLVDGGVVPAHGAAGKDTPDELRQQPSGELNLRHSLDGNRKKRTERMV